MENQNVENQNIEKPEVVEEKKKRKNNTKEYNAKYYADNKERILAMLCKMVICPLCGTSTSHQNLKRHQKGKLCKRRAERNNIV